MSIPSYLSKQYCIFLNALKLLVIWNGNSNILSFGSVIIDSLVFEVYMVSNDVLSSNERSSDVFDVVCFF